MLYIVDETTVADYDDLVGGDLLTVSAKGLLLGIIRNSEDDAAGIDIMVEGGVVSPIATIGFNHSAVGYQFVEVGETGYVRAGQFYSAIIMQGDHGTVINHGSISGGSALTLGSGLMSTVVNTGSMVGGMHAAVLLGADGQADVSNDGTIDGTDGIVLDGAAATVTNTGRIVGHAQRGIAIDAAKASAGLSIKNTGELVGQDRAVVGSAFADKVANLGVISGDLVLGNGNDVYNGEYGTADGAIRGAKGNDTLIGGNAADVLDGGGQDDRLRGGKGDDLLLGGSGHDVFIFRPGDGHDTVADFANDVDRLDLSAFHFGNFAAVSALATQTIEGTQGLLLNFSGHGNGSVFLAGVTTAQFDRTDITL